MSELERRIARLSPRKLELLARKLGGALEARRREAIAVVGMACRFPGGADSPDAYWNLLREGVDAIREVPSDRWPAARYYDPRPATPGKMSSKWGGFIEGVDRFDADFFGIPPREARSMDPQQRLTLEVSWEALDDAGLAGRVAGSDCGVFMGVSRADYAELHRVLRDPHRLDAYFGTGNAASFLAGRVSYSLGLRGPCFAVDTACSSSLVAVHTAAQSLRAGECDLALTGGVNLILSPAVSIYLSQLRTFSSDGRCRAFDAAADGYVRGEGCGVVVLKRESDARRDGDRIHALIRGSAVNQDGRSSGLTVPSRRAQVEVIRRALEVAQIEPEAIGFLEAHGTGTPLGDPIELEALADVMGLRGERKEGRGALPIGSVKTNFGHLEAAAGVAGLMKLILALDHGEIPPQLHFESGSTDVDWDGLALDVPTEVAAWPRGSGRRIGAVSSFGFSGTNAHVIVEEAADDGEDAPPHTEADAYFLLPLSTAADAALRPLASSYLERLEAANGEVLRDICFSAGSRRAHHRYRMTVEGENLGAVRGALDGYLCDAPPDEEAGRAVAGEAAPDSPSKVVFVFSGQGSHWWGMGRDLLRQQPVFRRWIERCDAVLDPLLGGSIASALAAERADTALARSLEAGELEAAQSALFAVQTGLAELWRHWGVTPGAFVGHSLGEVSAACAGGCLTLEQGARLVATRSRLLVDRGGSRGRGLMAAVALGRAEVEELLRGEPGAVWIGGENSPSWTVLSGEAGAVESVLARLEARGVACRRLATDGVAGHCPLVDDVGSELERELEDFEPSGAGTLVSTVHARRIPGRELDAAYWRENVRRPVLFRQAFDRLVDEGHRIFLEISPHPVLGGAMAACLEARTEAATGPPPILLASLRRDTSARRELLSAAGALYRHGVDLAWQHLYPNGRFVDLPPYPWRHARHWIDPEDAEPAPAPRGRLLSHAEIAADPALRRNTRALIERWGREGVAAVNLERLAPQVFVSPDEDAFFFVGRRGSDLVALLYVGPDEAFEPLVGRLREYTRENGLRLSLLATEDSVEALRTAGYLTTRCGVLQELDDLAAFTLAGRKMRRLRYLVERFRDGDRASTVECHPSEEPEIAREIEEVISAWAASRPGGEELTGFLRRKLLERPLGDDLRVFVTRRDGVLTHVVTLSRAPARGGYLLDLEFYRDDAPLGGLEFAIVKIIETLVAEGATYLSLGGTFGTWLEADEGEDPEAAATLRFLHERGVLNGDGNFQFKRKFRPRTTAIYLCQPAGETSDVAAILRFLAGDSPDDGSMVEGAPAVLGRSLDVASADRAFEREVDGELRSLFDQHRLAGRTLVPGAWFLAQALAAAGRAGHGSAVSDFEIRRPLLLGDGRCRLQTLVSREAHGVPRVRIFARQDGDADWVPHAVANLAPATGSPTSIPRRIDPESARSDLLPIEPGEFYATLAESGVEYGPDFRRARALWAGPGEALALVELGAGPDGESTVDPAGFDACLQIFAALDGASSAGETVVVRGIGQLSVEAPLTRSVWCRATVRESAEPTSASGTLALYSPDGRLLAFADPVLAGAARSIRRVTEPPDWAYELGWREIESDLPDPIRGSGAHWLVLDPEGSVATALRARLQEIGLPCTVAPRQASSSPEELAGALESIRRSTPDAEVRVVSLVPPATRSEGGVSVAHELARRALELIQTLHASPVARSCRLWLGTFGAQSVAGEAPRPAAAPIWGLAQVLPVESSALWGGLVDLDPALEPEHAADGLIRALMAEPEDRIAVRGTRLLAARMRRADVAGAPPFAADQEGGYVITGGGGGLGLFTADWLAERGARRLTLVGRRQPGEELASRMTALTARGVHVSYVRADVTALPEIEKVFQAFRRSGRPLAGVVHSAGVLADGLLSNQPWSRFERALGPKIEGTWNLHAASLDLEPGHFVLYSSLASVLGSPGQASHAAGNAFLDAFAHWRRAHGLPAVSVNWGPWSETGKAAGALVLERLARRGVSPIGPESAVAMLEAAFGTAPESRPQLAAAHIDWATWAAFDGARRQPPILEELLRGVREDPSTSRTATAPKQGALLEELAAAGEAERESLVLRDLLARVGGALGRSPDEIDPARGLDELGLDSLMVVEVREGIEAELGVNVPLVELFKDPSVADLASLVARGLEPAATPAGDGGDAEMSVEDRLAGLTDDEIEVVLRQLKEGGDRENEEGGGHADVASLSS